MIRVIITDIEGTTSSIAFVHQVLFPYAAAHLEAYVRQNITRPEVAVQLDAVAQEAGLDREDIDGLVVQLLSWIQEDRKVTPLKALQGLVWAQGYAENAYQGHVYADAAEYLRIWHDRGLRLYVYSSGSVQAQKQIFGCSCEGDLTPLFSGYFDTLVGGKKEASSYLNILQYLGLKGTEVLFLSDVEAELGAAQMAGMNTCWLVREGDFPESPVHPVVRDFAAADGVAGEL